MKASELDLKKDYPNFPEFGRFGIDLSKMDAALILKLQALRIKTGIPVVPSPVIAGWYRTDGSVNSRHYVVDRLSDAGDLFPARGRHMDFWMECLMDKEIGGLGLYIDTNGPDGNFWPMVHVDLRENRLLWVRVDMKYYYLHREPKNFWQAIAMAASV